jgi:hypothetical protein
VAFDPDVAVATVVPVTVDPVGMGVWWFHIGSGNPDVALTIPTMVAVVPCPVGMLVGRRRNDFMRTLWRTYTDYDLGLGYACGKKK